MKTLVYRTTIYDKIRDRYINVSISYSEEFDDYTVETVRIL